MTVDTTVQYPASGPTKGKVMILDYGYSQPRRGPTLGCCLRTLWSSDARVEFAQCASWAHAIGVLTTIATIAAILTASDTWLREAVVRGLAPKVNLGTWLFDELLMAGRPTSRLALQLIPIYFTVLAVVVYVIAMIWSSRVRHQSWTRCFAAASVGAVPLLWFFLLIQLECLSPLVNYDDLWHHHLNPLTNSVRFAVFVCSLGMVALWIFEAARLKDSVRYQR
jgi:hypothetical protein